LSNKVTIKSISFGGGTRYDWSVADESGTILQQGKSTKKPEASAAVFNLGFQYRSNSTFTNETGDTDFDNAFNGQVDVYGDYDESSGGTDAGSPPPEPPKPSQAPPSSVDAVMDIAAPGYSSEATQPGSFSSAPTSTITKPARSLKHMKKSRREAYESMTEAERCKRKINGAFNTKTVEPLITRELAENECVIGQDCSNNAFIILGKDRPGKLHTGYGGKAHTQCDAIDIVAGMGGHEPKEVDEDDVEIATNPNFFLDAARIYISQKTNVDKNFGIGEFGRAESADQNEDDKDDDNIGKYGAKSAIAIKADNIRIISRESMRLVTGTDADNSQGGTCLQKTGIELVAMNDVTTLQPMVLGENLAALLDKMIDQISAVAKVSHASTKYQMKMNQAVQNHIHISPFFGLPTLPSQQAQAGGIKCDIEVASKTELSTVKELTNLSGIKGNYLTSSGDSYILSRLNKVN